MVSWEAFSFFGDQSRAAREEESLHRGDRVLRGISVTSLFPVSVCVPTVPLK